ncbi:hypothetical protein L0128_19710 [candidate division KSB1 bacterium]|nr:hypothetical protein [candidate division KSB1 bacterium]
MRSMNMLFKGMRLRPQFNGGLRGAVIGLLLALLMLNASPVGAGEPVSSLAVIYTNDLMGYLEPCG